MARYYLRFRHSDNALTPTFTYFKKSSDHTDVGGPPAISGPIDGDGTYYFDYTPTFDIIFEVDGGASIADETIRYISDRIGPSDIYIDEPVSQVKTDVWEDNTVYLAGQKGKHVSDIGLPGDNSAQSTVFGKTLAYKESIRGDGAGLNDGNSVKEVHDRIGAPVGASISADVAAVKADTAPIAGMATQLTRALGLMHENSVVDNTVFDGSNNLTAARMRIYNSKANAEAAGGAGLVATYTITATYIGSNIETYTVVLEP
jgi:hypothetical protein